MNYMNLEPEVGRALSYCYEDKSVYALLANNYEVGYFLFLRRRSTDGINRAQESKKSALDGMSHSFHSGTFTYRWRPPAFKGLCINMPPASEINLYIFIGKQPGRKVYITEVGWQEVMALLKEKRVQVVHLEEKAKINDARPPSPIQKRSWWKSLPWAQIFTTASQLNIVKEVEQQGVEYAKDELLSDKG